MHSAIIVADHWDESHAGKQQWMAFAATISSLETNPAVEKLAPTAWQIEFVKSPAAFALLIHACELHGIPYRVLAFEKVPPEWVSVRPAPRG